MPDTLDPEGFDPERHIVGEEALREWRDLGIRAAGVVTGDTQLARLRPTILLILAAAAMTAAPWRARIVGTMALMLALADLMRRRP